MNPRDYLIKEMLNKSIDRIVLSEGFYQKLLGDGYKLKREGTIYEKPYIVDNIKEDFQFYKNVELIY